MKKAFLIFVVGALFSLGAVAKVEGSYVITKSNKEALGCFGDYLDKATGSLEMTIGEFDGQSADRSLKFNFERRGAAYKITCEVLYKGVITMGDDGKFYGGLSWKAPGGFCKCSPDIGSHRNCERRIDPFLAEADGVELNVEYNESGISVQQAIEFPGSGETACGREYPVFDFGRQ